VSRVERFLAYTLLFVGAIAFLIPFYFVFNASLKGQAEVEAGDFSRPVVLPPREPGTRLANDTAPDAVTKAIGGATLTELYERVVKGTEPGDPPVRSYIARVSTADWQFGWRRHGKNRSARASARSSRASMRPLRARVLGRVPP
jgi:ABC-type glycerol-3-phosphate transport system permease component